MKEGCKTVGRRPSNPRKIVPTSRGADVGRMVDTPDHFFNSITQDHPSPDKCLWIVAANLKEARLRKGLSQEEAAKKVGISASQLSRYEGEKTKPTYGTIIKLCNLYGVSPAYVMGFVSENDLSLDLDVREFWLITAIREAGLGEGEMGELEEHVKRMATYKRATRNVKHKGTHQKPNLPPKYL